MSDEKTPNDKGGESPPTETPEKTAEPEVKPEVEAEAKVAETAGESLDAAAADQKVAVAAESPKEPAEATKDADPVEAKKTSVDEIARRAFALEEEDAGEKFAREQEAKLAERRAEAKRAKKKGALEASASKKLADIGTTKKKKKAEEEEEDEADVAPAKVYADPLLERTTRFTAWASKNKNVVGYLVVAAVVGLVGTFGYLHFKQQKEGEASVELVAAIAAQRGHVGEPPKDAKDKDDDPVSGPTFATAKLRSEDALKKFRDVQSKYPGTGAAILARLAEGSVHLDLHDAEAALKCFTDVKSSALALADKEVKGRALEGLGFAQEQKGQNKEALATFKELENTVEIVGFKEVSIYHQARLHETLGEKDKAKELLLSLRERISKPDMPPLDYLKVVVDERLRALDPKAVPQEDPMKALMGGGGGMTPELMRRLQEQMKKKGSPGGGHGP